MWRTTAVPFRSYLTALIAFWTILMASGTATATSFVLETEFDTGVTGPFATVEVTENDGALDFLISISLEELGMDADLHVFYFNLVGDDTGLMISDTNAPNSEYVLESMPSVAGGAGSSFDWAVEFGNGAGPMGNFQLQTASFTLSLFGDLFVSNLLESSFASGGSMAVQMAAHIQGSSALTGATSETIGGTIVPEPSTAMLLAVGFSLLAGRRRTAQGRNLRA